MDPLGRGEDFYQDVLRSSVASRLALLDGIVGTGHDLTIRGSMEVPELGLDMHYPSDAEVSFSTEEPSHPHPRYRMVKASLKTVDVWVDLLMVKEVMSGQRSKGS